MIDLETVLMQWETYSASHPLETFNWTPFLVSELKATRKVVAAATRLCNLYPGSTPADFADLYLALRELDGDK